MHDALILMTNIGRVDVSRVEHKGALDRYIWTLLFRAYDGDLNTLQVQPDTSFLGKGASIHVQRPRGVKPLSYLIGNADEIPDNCLAPHWKHCYKRYVQVAGRRIEN